MAKITKNTEEKVIGYTLELTVEEARRALRIVASYAPYDSTSRAIFRALKGAGVVLDDTESLPF